MRRLWIVTVLFVTAFAAGGVLWGQQGTSARSRASVQLEAAIKKEVVDGDIKAAIELYGKLAQSSDRAVAARALMRMAECHQKLGDAQAKTVYERVVKEFGDQTAEASEARTRLAAMGGVSATTPTTPRLVWRVNVKDTDLDIHSISLDGRLAIGTDYTTDPMDLAFRDMSSGQLTHLGAATTPFSLSQGGWPILSPDGQQVAFLWNAGATARDFVAELRVMSATPGAKARVVMKNPEVTYFLPNAWSPDGRRVLVGLHRPDRTWQLAWVSVADGSTKILKSLDWRMQHTANAVSLSPNGRYVAYCALAVNPAKPLDPPESKDTRIYVIAADGSTETVLTRTAGQNCFPTWSADGKQVVFLSDRAGSPGLWSVAVQDGKASGTPSLLKADVGDISPVGVTRSGSYHYVTYARIDRISVDSSPATSRPDRLVQPGNDIIGINPSWSPDGKSLAFTRYSPRGKGDGFGAAAEFYDLVVHSLETGEERTYMCDGLMALRPIWFPDGSRVLVQAWPTSLRNSRPNQVSWYSIDLKTSNSKKLLPSGAAAEQGSFAGFSPNGHDVYFFVSRPSNGLARIDLATGEQTEMFSLPKDTDATFAIQKVRLSPDGRTLAIASANTQGEAHLATATLGGSDYRLLHSMPAKQVANGKTTRGINHYWSTDGKLIYFLEADSQGGNVMRISAQGGAPEFSGFAPRNGLFSIDPTGSRVAYSMRDRIQELWVLGLAALRK